MLGSFAWFSGQDARMGVSYKYLILMYNIMELSFCRKNPKGYCQQDR